MIDYRIEVKEKLGVNNMGSMMMGSNQMMGNMDHMMYNMNQMMHDMNQMHDMMKKINGGVNIFVFLSPSLDY